MRIHIEKREPNKQGKRHLRLVYYLGSRIHPISGKRYRHRRREPLDLYVYDDPKTLQQRQHNKVALKIAETIKARRLSEAISDTSFLAEKDVLAPINFFDYATQMLQSKPDLSPSSQAVWTSALKQLQYYHGSTTLILNQINGPFLHGFKTYLQSQAVTRRGQPLSVNTASHYLNKIRAIMKQAQREGFVDTDINWQVDPIPATAGPRTYLTQDELSSLYQAECRYPVLKQAFLFSCLTGLSWSAIQKLSWSHMTLHDSEYRLYHATPPAQDQLAYLILPYDAIDLLGPRQVGEHKVFQGLKYSSWYNSALQTWAQQADITKHITFHTARHTFAIQQLLHGTDIYKLSKLLGHTALKATQVYADIVQDIHRESLHTIPDTLFIPASKQRD